MRTLFTAALLLTAWQLAPAAVHADDEKPATPKGADEAKPAPKVAAKKDRALPTEHPLRKDKTGMRWTLPFKAAQATAASAKRLLMIKPVAFGTAPDGGW